MSGFLKSSRVHHGSGSFALSLITYVAQNMFTAKVHLYADDTILYSAGCIESSFSFSLTRQQHKPVPVIYANHSGLLVRNPELSLNIFLF